MSYWLARASPLQRRVSVSVFKGRTVRYSHTIHEDALRALFALSVPERRKMLRECESITRRPSIEPDYIRSEADGRAMSVVIRCN